jgi:hypothetical protein
VVRLSTAHVKSARMRSVDQLALTDAGAVDDRRFAVIDDQGQLQTARKIAALLQIGASIDPPRSELKLSFPDGSTVRGPIRHGPRVSATFAGDPFEAASIAGTFDDVLSGFLRQPVQLVEALEPGSIQDGEPLTSISAASILEVERLGDARRPLDARRFRMNIELGGCQAFEEDTWRGQRLTIGTAVVEVVSRTRRCVVTSLDPESGTRSIDVLRMISRRGLPRDEGLPLGVSLRVVTPGVVSLGDRVRPASD